MKAIAVIVIFVVCVLMTMTTAVSARRRVTVKADPVEHEYEVSVNGTQRTFYVYVPSSYTGATAFPLLVFFHGAFDACQLSSNTMLAGFASQQTAGKFLLAAPCGLNKMWTGSVDLPFAEALLDLVGEQYNVDKARIYSSGFSNGAGLTNYMGCRIPNRWTGGISFAAGSIMGDTSSSDQSNAQALATCDSKFALANATVNVFKLQGAVDPIVLPYGASSSVAMRDDFYGWALRNGCKGSPTTVAETDVYKDERFQDCPPDVTVRLVMMYGIAHQWVQSASFNYNTEILKQFNLLPATARRSPRANRH